MVDLGFEPSFFHEVQFNPAIKEKVLKDILSPQFSGEMPRGVVKRVIFKFRRWHANSWKHALCYKESMWSAFWSGVWAKVLKPAGI